MKRCLVALAVAALTLTAPAGAGARDLGLTRIGETPPPRAGDQPQVASDGHRLLFFRTGQLTLRVVDTISRTTRDLDLSTVGVRPPADCGPADATRTLLLVSCDYAGAVLLRLPTFARAAVVLPTPPLAFPTGVPRTWSRIGRHWLAGRSNCDNPKPICPMFYLNYRTGAHRRGGVIWDGLRLPWAGTRLLDDPELGPVRGCERIDFASCDEEAGYVVRLGTQGWPGRLELLRAGRVAATVARPSELLAPRLQAGRAAWIESDRVRLYDTAHGRRATYAVPALGRLYRATEVVQTANRILVAVESTDPVETSYFYVGTVPRALR